MNDQEILKLLDLEAKKFQHKNSTSENPSIFNGIKMKCPSGNDALTYCLSCTNCSVACIDESCYQCYRTHLKCQRMKKIRQFHHSIQQSITPTFIFGQIQHNLKHITTSTQNLQDKIRQQLQTFKLTKSDLEIINKIKKYHNQKQKLSSSDFEKYHKQKQIQQKQWLHQQTNKFQRMIHQTQNQVNKYFGNIYKSIYYEHLENCKDFEEKIIKESYILDKKFTKNQMLLMLKDLQPIQQIKRIYCGSKDGFTTQIFHKLCDNKANLLYVVKNQFDKTYGGYSPCKISQGNSQKFQIDQSMSSFIFSLDNHIKSNVVKKQFSIRNSYKPKGKGSILVAFGQASSPNLVISQNSFGVARDNFIDLYGGAYQENQQNIAELIGTNEGLTFKLKQFQVFEISFKKLIKSSKMVNESQQFQVKHQVKKEQHKNQQKMASNKLNQMKVQQKVQIKKQQPIIPEKEKEKKQQKPTGARRGRQSKQKKPVLPASKQKKVTKKPKATKKPKSKPAATRKKTTKQYQQSSFSSSIDYGSNDVDQESYSNQQSEHYQVNQEQQQQEQNYARRPGLLSQLFGQAIGNNRLGFLFRNAQNNEQDEQDNQGCYSRFGYRFG